MELYAVRYGETNFRLKDIYRDKAESHGKIPTDWLFYLAIVNEHVVLIDTGFRSKLWALLWGLNFTDHAGELAALLNGRPVDTVVITHAHFDHMDNLDLYSGAKVIISKEARKAAMTSRPKSVQKILQTSSVTDVDDCLLIEDTFLFKVIGGHAKGSCVLYFTAGGLTMC